MFRLFLHRLPFLSVLPLEFFIFLNFLLDCCSVLSPLHLHRDTSNDIAPVPFDYGFDTSHAVLVVMDNTVFSVIFEANVSASIL